MGETETETNSERSARESEMVGEWDGQDRETGGKTDRQVEGK